MVTWPREATLITAGLGLTLLSSWLQSPFALILFHPGALPQEMLNQDWILLFVQGFFSSPFYSPGSPPGATEIPRKQERQEGGREVGWEDGTVR